MDRLSYLSYYVQWTWAAALVIMYTVQYVQSSHPLMSSVEVPIRLYVQGGWIAKVDETRICAGGAVKIPIHDDDMCKADRYSLKT
jgi:hypothetical protein